MKTGASEGATEAILLVDRTQIADSGKYTMTVDNDGADESPPHSSSINVEIVGEHFRQLALSSCST